MLVFPTVPRDSNQRFMVKRISLKFLNIFGNMFHEATVVNKMYYSDLIRKRSVL